MCAIKFIGNPFYCIYFTEERNPLTYGGYIADSIKRRKYINLTATDFKCTLTNKPTKFITKINICDEVLVF